MLNALQMKCNILLLVVTIAGVTIAGDFYNVNGTNYYISHPMQRNYHQAYRYCVLNGMYLVSVHSQENHNSVLEAINRWNTSYPGSIHFWTSGTSLGHPEKEFYWATTGLPLTFSNWIPSAPNNAKQKCIILHGGNTHQYGWVDQVCETQHQFICEDKIVLPKIKSGDEC